MLRKSGSGNDGGKKKGSSKEGAFDKNWDKLSAKKKPVLEEKGLAVSSGKAELNATILQALTAIDQPDAVAARSAVVEKATGAHAKMSISAPPVDPSTAKTEATATGLGPNAVLNVMWEHLEMMADQYNDIVGPGPFNVKMQRETEGKSRATMTTLTHSLMLIPDADAVRLYVLPVELNRGEYGQGPQFEPNSIVLMSRNGNRIEWQTKPGTQLTAAVMNSICRTLFQSLIEQTASYYT
jgi:hypothetical protein